MIVKEEIEPIDVELAKYILPENASEKAVSTVGRLSEAMRNGHLCLRVDKNHQIPDELITNDPLLDDLPKTPFCQVGGLLYFQRFWVCEAILEKNFKRLSSQNNEYFDLDKVRELTATLFLRPKQKEAILKAAEKPILFLCGGPGTGKTYTAGNLLKVLRQSAKEEFEIALVAPTGKAAAQLQKSLQNSLEDGFFQLQATTIHSFLKIKKNKRPSLLKPDTVSADLVLVDESSMVDVELLALLFASLKDGARLILLGDPNQLPPVEAGSLFHDLVEREKELGGAVVELDESLRQENEALISFGQAVKSGDVEKVLEHLENEEGPAWLQATEEDLFKFILKKLPKHPDPKLPPIELLSLFQSFALLTPFRRGKYGFAALNEKILPYYPNVYPILVTRNDKELELFNGDIGVLVRQSEQELTPEDKIYFSDQKGGYRELPALVLPSFEPAFALSVHKSQGSEYNEVLFLLPEGSEKFGREVFYTAITRAKRKITIWGEGETIRECISRSEKRLSGVGI